MRLALLHPQFTHRGGAGLLTIWLAEQLASAGHEVSLVAAGHDWDRWGGAPAGVRLLDLAEGASGSMPTADKAARLIARELVGVELLLAGNHPAHRWAVEAAARMSPRPRTVLYCNEPNRKYYFNHTDRPLLDYLAGNRDSLPFGNWLREALAFRRRYQRLSRAPLVRWQDRRSLKSLDKVIANSAWTAGTVLSAWGISADVCPPGVPYRDETLRPTFDERSGILVLSGWDLPKNPMGVLGAVREVAQAGRREITFTLVGSGRHPRYDEYLERHRLRDQVVLVDSLPEEEKYHALSRSRLTLYVPLAEPFGLVPVESMLCGTPVVGSNHAGPSEVILPGETGLQVDPFEPGEIASALLSLYDDRAAWERMSDLGHERARSEFTIAAMVDRLLPLLA